MSAAAPLGMPWYVVTTAPWVQYALAPDGQGVAWLYFHCTACGDVSKRPCSAPQERGPHWVATYAGLHTHDD